MAVRLGPGGYIGDGVFRGRCTGANDLHSAAAAGRQASCVLPCTWATSAVSAPLT